MTLHKTVDRVDLHQLVDALPDETLQDARAALKPFIDPVLFAFLTAPVDDEEWTEEELALIAEGEADAADGYTYSLEEAKARLLGTRDGVMETTDHGDVEDSRSCRAAPVSGCAAP